MSRERFKIILIGDSSVGKTALTARFCYNRYTQTQTTVSLDLCSKEVFIDGRKITLDIWDTAGTEKIYLTLSPQYYRDVDAIIIVYDMTEITTFKTLHFWLNECELHGIDINNVPRALVGNKSDLAEKNAVSHEMGKRFARQNKLPFFETSAKDDNESDTVNNIFLTIARQLVYQKPKLEKKDTIDKVVLNKPLPPSKKESSCC